MLLYTCFTTPASAPATGTSSLTYTLVVPADAATKPTPSLLILNFSHKKNRKQISPHVRDAVHVQEVTHTLIIKYTAKYPGPNHT